MITLNDAQNIVFYRSQDQTQTDWQAGDVNSLLTVRLSEQKENLYQPKGRLDGLNIHTIE